MKVIYHTDEDISELRRDSWYLGAICGFLAGLATFALAVRWLL